MWLIFKHDFHTTWYQDRCKDKFHSNGLHHMNMDVLQAISYCVDMLSYTEKNI